MTSFNKIDETVLNSLLSTNLNGETSSNDGAIINFIQSVNEREHELCVVKTNKKKTMIPSSETVVISCRTNTGYLDVETPALFEPDTTDCLPSGLEAQ